MGDIAGFVWLRAIGEGDAEDDTESWCRDHA
jgi:hypothetical protein